MVSFEATERTLARRETGLPLGLDFVEGKNWSLLHVAADHERWFRSPSLYAFFDELTDVAFFEEFDRVLFYGAGMGGYAAAAYSVVAPGAIVLAIAPQATLDRARTPWEPRFPTSRRLDFESRYGYAPSMIEGAARAYILFDPHFPPDAMHGSLFFGDNVVALPCRRLRSDIEDTLEDLGLLHQVIEAAADGTLSPVHFAKLMRGRRTYTPYLRNLLGAINVRQQPLRAALLCQAVLKGRRRPVFRQTLQVARGILAKQDRLPDWLDGD